MIEKENIGRLEKNPSARKIFFHTDAVQAAEYFELGVKYLHVDLLTMTAHKIYGPKGIGLLFVKKGTPLKPEITGGGQEYKKRAGTENVAGIVGFGVACEFVIKDRADTEGGMIGDDFPELKMSNATKKSTKIRDKMIRGILDKIPDAELNGTDICRSPNNVNISFRGIEGESILLNLDMIGIAASTGSACTSGSLEPSHVIMALGYPEERAHSSIRFTIGKYTTEEEIDRLLDVLPGIIEKLRAMSPIK
jgi:cysteine desulfurase